MWTVKGVAQLAGVSVRTMHHYDEIGLLKPTHVNPSGYRLYTEQDLERLQQVLFFRELGLSLTEIKQIIDSPGFDRRRALQEHKELLQERQERLSRLIRSIDRTLNAMERGARMDEKEMFDGFDQSQYEEEARQRWGHTEAYKESTARAKKYRKEDWDAIKQQGSEIEQQLAALMDRGAADPEVQTWIGRHHQMINDRFYTCSTEIYRGLGDLYVADERFTAYYERIRPGMAAFMNEAMHLYCDKLEGK